MNEIDGELCFSFLDDEHLNESYAKRRSDEAQTHTQLFASVSACAHSFSEEDVVALFVSLVFSRFLSLSLSLLSLFLPVYI